MLVTILGTGTSQGVPVLNCTCTVCSSTDPKDSRLRCAVLIQHGNTCLLIDAGPDLRQQLLKRKPDQIDAVLLTHEHSDHVNGMDDLRPYIFQKGGDMPIYGLLRVMDDIRNRFSYAFQDSNYPGIPRFELHDIQPDLPFTIGDITVTPISIQHGELPILGYRIGEFAYITDAKSISDASIKLLHGIPYLIINALKKEEHPTHCNLDEALRYIQMIQPKQAWLTHISHDMGLHSVTNQELPAHIQCAYDGLTLQIGG